MSASGKGSEEPKPPAQVAVVDRGRVALTRRDDGALGLPELPGWDGEAWRYPAAISARAAALPAPLARPVTHLAPLLFGDDGQPPVNLVEAREPGVEADAWWSPGDPAPAGMPGRALPALVAALSGGAGATGWPPFCLPGTTAVLLETLRCDPVLASRASLSVSSGKTPDPRELEQVQGWGLSSVWRNAELVLKLTHPAWPAEAAVTDLLAEVAPELVPSVLSVGTVAGVGGPYLVQARVVEPPDDSETDDAYKLGRTLQTLRAVAEVQLAAGRRTDDLARAGVERRTPSRTAAELPDLWAACERALDEERRGKLPQLDRLLREDLVRLESAPAVLVHGDLHLGNVLQDAAGGPQLIDWTDAAFAWPGVDLWMPSSRLKPNEEEREELYAAYLEALGPEHELGIRVGARAAPAYHALSNLRIARFLPSELAGPFDGYIGWLVGKQFEEYGL